MPGKVRPSLPLVLALALLAASPPPHATTRTFAFQGRAAVAEADAAADDRRGAAVALAGDVLLVGAPGDSLSIGNRVGSVLVYRRGATGWRLETKLLPPTPRVGGGFGTALAIEGATAVVGATGESAAGGAAYVYVHDGAAWQLQATLDPEVRPDASIARFGAAVALQGGRVLVGAPGTTFSGGAPLGAAFVFVRSGASWAQTARLRAPLDAPAGTQFFGGSVALSGPTAMVGTRSPNGGIRGAAYAFEHAGGDTWGPAQALAPPQPLPANAAYGAGIALDGDLAVVSAPGAPAQILFRRVAGQWVAQASLEVPGDAVAIAPPYVYIGQVSAVAAYALDGAGTGWQALGGIAPPPGAGGFGAAVAADGDRVAIGAPATVPAGGSLPSGSASVHVAAGEAFVLESNLAPALGPFDGFGEAVAVAGDDALVGAPYSDAAQGHVQWLTRRAGGWQVAGELRAPEGRALLYFGSSIALAGDHALVGAPGFNETGAGGNRSAWLFRRTESGWEVDAALSTPEDISFDRYGAAVALSGGWAFVGAPAAVSSDSSRRGVVHVFAEGPAGWVRQQVLLPPEPEPFAQFGTAMAVADGMLLVGAPSTSALTTGSVHVFRPVEGSWQHVQTLAGDIAGSRFGASVHLDGSAAWVGAPATPRGSVYRFARSATGFDSPQRIDAPAPGTGFGGAIGGSATEVFAGAFAEGFGAGALTIPGAVYRLVSSGGEWVAGTGIPGTALSPLAQFAGFAVAADANATIIGAPRSGSPPPFGNPQEGAAFIIDASNVFADGFEP